MALTNAAGTLVERYIYSAYGMLGIYDPGGTVRSSSTYGNRYTYTGREWDPDLNLYHFRARWYDPATGGFITRDPLSYVDGMSLYRGYFGVKDYDSSGMIKRCILTNAIPLAGVVTYWGIFNGSIESFGIGGVEFTNKLLCHCKEYIERTYSCSETIVSAPTWWDTVVCGDFRGKTETTFWIERWEETRRTWLFEYVIRGISRKVIIVGSSHLLGGNTVFEIHKDDKKRAEEMCIVACHRSK